MLVLGASTVVYWRGVGTPCCTPPEQWYDILLAHLAIVPCQNACHSILPDKGILDDIWYNFIESVCLMFPPDPLVSPPISHEKLLQNGAKISSGKKPRGWGLSSPNVCWKPLSWSLGFSKGWGCVLGYGTNIQLRFLLLARSPRELL